MGQALYRVERSRTRKWVDGLITCAYFAFLVYWYWTGRGHDAIGYLAWFLCAAVLLSSNLLGRIRFTETGIERRTWYGRKIFSPYDEMLALEESCKYITIQCRAEELRIEKKQADLNKIADILRSRAARYGYDS